MRKTKSCGALKGNVMKRVNRHLVRTGTLEYVSHMWDKFEVILGSGDGGGIVLTARQSIEIRYSDVDPLWQPKARYVDRINRLQHGLVPQRFSWCCSRR
jgi:hypothetical protein